LVAAEGRAVSTKALALAVPVLPARLSRKKIINHGTPSAAEPQPHDYTNESMGAEISALATTSVSSKR
jgi:hypothetical protein